MAPTADLLDPSVRNVEYRIAMVCRDHLAQVLEERRLVQHHRRSWEPPRRQSKQGRERSPRSGAKCSQFQHSPFRPYPWTKLGSCCPMSLKEPLVVLILMATPGSAVVPVSVRAHRRAAVSRAGVHGHESEALRTLCKFTARIHQLCATACPAAQTS